MKALIGWLFLVGTAFLCSGPTIIDNASGFATLVLIEGVWFLSLYFPAFIPLAALIIGGLIADFLLPDPPGFIFLALLLSYCVADVFRRRFIEWGLFFWMNTFGALFGFDMILFWILSSVQSWRLLSPLTFLLMWVIGLVVYVPMYMVFTKLKDEEVKNSMDL